MPYDESPEYLHVGGDLRAVRRLEPTAVGGGTEILRKPILLVAIKGPSQEKLSFKASGVVKAVRAGEKKASGRDFAKEALGEQEAAHIAFHGDTICLGRPGQAPDGRTTIPPVSVILGRVPTTSGRVEEQVIGVGHRLEENKNKLGRVTNPYTDQVDGGVSARHLKLTVAQQLGKPGSLGRGLVVMAEDLGSTNGTREFDLATRTEEPINAATLKKGDSLHLGEKTIVRFDGFDRGTGLTGGMAMFRVISR